jgi:hypothetical protein
LTPFLLLSLLPAALAAAPLAPATAAALAAATRAAPDTAAWVGSALPAQARNGAPIFTDPRFFTPGGLAAAAQRLAAGEDPPPVRAALAQVVVRGQALPPADVVALFHGEPAADVRAVLVAGAADFSAADAEPFLVDALRDPAAPVRAAALRALSQHPAGAAWGRLAALSTTDADATVRALAVRHLGWSGDRGGWDLAAAALEDAAPEVRLAALRAVERLDAPRAAGLAAVQRLAADPDAAVATAARRVQGGAR